jgi:endonuclease/exonuclease/phosphatase family metal-dependent hydrolase
MVNYKLVNSGLVILSVYPIQSYKFIPFDDQEYLSADILSEKGFLVIDILYKKIPLTIINTHLQSNSKLNVYDTGMKQINQILSFVRTLTTPFILGGDFNVPYQKFPVGSYKLYRPPNPTIYIKYTKSGNEIDTSSLYKPYFKPFIFDYFITSGVLLLNTYTLETNYSDHLPVYSTIYHIL